MSVCLITGSSGLVGAQSVEHFAQKKFDVVGVDNDMRRYFFGKEASTAWMRKRLEKNFKNYTHSTADIRNKSALEKIFKKYRKKIRLIIHSAAQPSHDWAAKEPLTDFNVNAVGTMNLLELTRQYCPEAVFIFMSTNKVYGDRPNSLPLVEQDKRWEIREGHPYYNGIDEQMSIDASKHSLFGASKAAADLLVQEYGRYFGMKTVCFRGGCLTGPHHSGAMLHGFLSYLVKCCLTSQPYTILGYKGKQVRDNIHSYDLAEAFDQFYQNPRPGEVYNIGGGRENSCSILEAIDLCEKLTGRKMKYSYSDQNRSGDHIWYISSLQKFQAHYPQWRQKYTLQKTLQEIIEGSFLR